MIVLKKCCADSVKQFHVFADVAAGFVIVGIVGTRFQRPAEWVPRIKRLKSLVVIQFTN